MIRLFSPAKINLFLRVLSKRKDGFHELSSLFQTISLGDTLSIELTSQNKDELTSDNSRLPLDEKNLILKATHQFRNKTGLKVFFKIHLEKKIPMEAGLGGGSSNAATALWGCNQLTGIKKSLTELKQWGGEIGSDIPFFFSQGTAYCTGRGECVQHLPALASRTLWVIKPSEGLSTPEVYGKLDLTKNEKERIFEHDLDAFLSGFTPHFNDLEFPAFELKPELKQLKQELLERGFETVLMSGSGTAFFCIGKGTLPDNPKLKIYSAKFINRSLNQWYPDS